MSKGVQVMNHLLQLHMNAQAAWVGEICLHVVL